MWNGSVAVAEYDQWSISKADQDSINNLIPQLSDSAQPISSQKLNGIISSENSFLFLAKEEKRFIGTVTLVIVDIPTSKRALVEDVVVDKKFLGKSIGEKLTLHAINFAKEKGASTVNLTCSPRRIAANALYKKLGFEKRDTNVYKLDI